MKILFLNIWGGEKLSAVTEFLSEVSADVLCLQEVFFSEDTHRFIEGRTGKQLHTNLFEEVQTVLPSHRGLFVGGEKGYIYEGAVDHHQEFGLASFVRSDFSILDHGEVQITDVPGKHGYFRNLQYIKLKTKKTPLLICNLHGLHIHHDKTDTPERISQSKNILNFLDQYQEKSEEELHIVLGGDFNLRKETRSLKMIASYGFRNLIEEYEIPTTRSDLYDRKEESPFADYCFVSPEIQVNDFKVPNINISDHLPLILDIAI